MINTEEICYPTGRAGEWGGGWESPPSNVIWSEINLYLQPHQVWMQFQYDPEYKSPIIQSGTICILKPVIPGIKFILHIDTLPHPHFHHLILYLSRSGTFTHTFHSPVGPANQVGWLLLLTRTRLAWFLFSLTECYVIKLYLKVINHLYVDSSVFRITSRQGFINLKILSDTPSQRCCCDSLSSLQINFPTNCLELLSSVRWLVELDDVSHNLL